MTLESASVALPAPRAHRRLPGTIRLTVPRSATAAMAVAAAAVVPALGNQPLSWNEAVTLSAAQRTLPNLMTLLHQRDAPLGSYYALIHLWLATLHHVGIEPTATWLRLPSAIGAIGACGLLVVIGARWFDVRTALLAGAFLAVHPMLTFYAQDARPYALVTCAYLASTWALLRALDRPTLLRMSCYGVLATTTIYLHMFAIYALAAHVVLVAGARQARIRWAAVGAAVMIAAIPLFALAHGERAELGWIPRPTLAIVAAVTAHMFGGPALIATILLVAALAIRHGGLPRDRRALFLGVWLLVPVVALVAVDFVVPDLVARYGLVSVPAAALLVAAAAGRRQIKALAAVILVVAAVTTGWQQSRAFKYEDYRSAADAMGDLARPGDAVMFFPISTRVGFEVYRATESDLRNVHDLAMLPGVLPTATGQLGGVDRPPAAISKIFQTAPTIFVLGDSMAQARRSLHDPTDVAQQAALRGYRVSRSTRYGNLYLTVLQRGSATRALVNSDGTSRSGVK